MMVTTELASTLWCPFARSYNYDDDNKSVSSNRAEGGAPDPWCRCITTNCMAWRWYDTNSRLGYCGLVYPTIGVD